MTQPNDYKPSDEFNQDIEQELATKEEKKHHSLSFSLNVLYRVFRSIFLIGILIAAALGFLGLGIGTGYFASLVSDLEVPGKEELAQKINDVEQQSKILYSNDELVSVIKSDLIRTSVKSDDISPLVKKALISTEDENFYEHHGVVPKAIARATLSDVIGVGGSSGGSTITQQLIKQQVLTSETSYKRKASEILLAARTENFFTKEAILNAYLNVSPFGRNNRGENIAGIEEASQGIFGVHAKEVSLPQAAYLAGLPQSPIEYSPYTNKGEFKKEFKDGLRRKDDVLFNMYREKMINNKEYEEAKKYDLTKDFKQPEPPRSDESGFLYNYLYDEAARVTMPIYYEKDGLTQNDINKSTDLEQKYLDIAKRELRQNGYTIKTSIDKDIHNAMQEASQEFGHVLDDGRGKLLETGSVLMENKTGRIYGFIGGRDYSQNQFNHAFSMRRSPGSTIKPLIAYAPAIDSGLIGSESKLADFPKKYSDGTEINNYSDKGSSTFKSVRESLKWSLNIPVVNLYGEMRDHVDAKEYFNKMNIGLEDEEYSYESIPLGGTQHGMTVNEETAAYATLANKGVYNEPYSIEKITDTEGNIIYEHKKEPVEVFKPSTASIMNDMMRDVLKSGTGEAAKDALYSQSATLSNADWVGKTGTSELQKDYWFTASTPSVTMSNWIGYDDNTQMYDTWNKQNMIFWAYVTNYVYQRNPDIFGVNEKFSLDSSVNKQKVVDFTGQKEGSFNTEGYNMNTRGSKTKTSLYSAGNNAPDSSFRFGIGGSDDNYKSAWNSYIRPTYTPKPYKKR